MTNQQSKAWSAALKRAARLIEKTYGIECSTAEAAGHIAVLNRKKRKGILTGPEMQLLEKLEAAE